MPNKLLTPKPTPYTPIQRDTLSVMPKINPPPPNTKSGYAKTGKRK